MSASDTPGFSALDVLIVHLVNHRSRPNTLGDTCPVLDIEDTHLANYAIRKLKAQGLVQTGREGKEKTVNMTPKGTEGCLRHARMREPLLVRTARQLGHDPAELPQVATPLR